MRCTGTPWAGPGGPPVNRHDLGDNRGLSDTSRKGISTAQSSTQGEFILKGKITKKRQWKINKITLTALFTKAKEKLEIPEMAGSREAARRVLLPLLAGLE